MPSRVARLRLAQAVENQFDTSVVAAFEAILASSRRQLSDCHEARSSVRVSRRWRSRLTRPPRQGSPSAPPEVVDSQLASASAVRDRMPELVVDVTHVHLHGFDRDEQPLRDLAVLEALAQQVVDLALPCRTGSRPGRARWLDRSRSIAARSLSDARPTMYPAVSDRLRVSKKRSEKVGTCAVARHDVVDGACLPGSGQDRRISSSGVRSRAFNAVTAAMHFAEHGRFDRPCGLRGCDRGELPCFVETPDATPTQARATTTPRRACREVIADRSGGSRPQASATLPSWSSARTRPAYTAC